MREDDSLIQLQAAANAAAVRGSLLFHLDLAAALGLDALVATETGADTDAGAEAATNLYTVLVDGEGYGVLAIADGVAPQERAIVRFAADGRPIVQPRSGPPRAADLARARAARTVTAAKLTGQGQAGTREAIVAIPQSSQAHSSDPIEVYALALPDVPADVVLGVHWYAKVSADGATILSSEPLSKAPLVLPSQGGEPPFGVQVTHFGAVPSEIHTWLSLKHGMALSVIALESDTVWMVEAERTTREGRIS